MILEEKEMDLFDISNDFYLAHCISADYVMGKGIAVKFNKLFNIKNTLMFDIPRELKIWPTCVMIGPVFNLITKEKYYGKPTYSSLKHALISMRDQIVALNINKLAMPKIGCGLDRLNWDKVKYYIEEVFKDVKIHIVICSIE